MTDYFLNHLGISPTLNVLNSVNTKNEMHKSIEHYAENYKQKLNEGHVKGVSTKCLLENGEPHKSNIKKEVIFNYYDLLPKFRFSQKLY